MHAQRAPSALGEDLEVATRLSRFYNSKRIFLAGHWQLDGIVAGDLQEYSGVRAAFVRLAGGVQETRAESQARCHAFFVAHGVAQSLQRLLVLSVHLDVAQRGEVVASLDAVDMSFNVACERRAAAGSLGQVCRILLVGEQLEAGIFEDWFLRRQRS